MAGLSMSLLECISFYNYIQDESWFTVYVPMHSSLPVFHPKFPRFKLSEELFWDLAEAHFGPKSR
jgi:hypothetical protein